jgi:hypothetical protein
MPEKYAALSASERGSKRSEETLSQLTSVAVSLPGAGHPIGSPQNRHESRLVKIPGDFQRLYAFLRLV